MRWNFSIPVISAGEKLRLPFHKLDFLKRTKRAGLRQNIRSFWEAAKTAKVFGILDVPQIGTKKDRKGKSFRHNAASRGYRHGDKGTELAFPLIAFLDGKKPGKGTYVWIPCDRRTSFWYEAVETGFKPVST